MSPGALNLIVDDKSPFSSFTLSTRHYCCIKFSKKGKGEKRRKKSKEQDWKII